MIKSNGLASYISGSSWGKNRGNLFIELDHNFNLKKKQKVFNDSDQSVSAIVKTINLNNGSILTIGYSNHEATNENCNKWIIRKF